MIARVEVDRDFEEEKHDCALRKIMKDEGNFASHQPNPYIDAHKKGITAVAVLGPLIIEHLKLLNQLFLLLVSG